MPELGTFNLHASLLPQYRGAAPINWAIINGETTTGVTTFLLNEKIDEGKILLQESIAISQSDTAETIHDKLADIGKKLVIKTVEGLVQNNLCPTAQPNDSIELKPAPKIFKTDCAIDWSKNGRNIVNFVRGLSPYPAATMALKDSKDTLLSFKVFEVSFEQAENVEPFKVYTDQKEYLKIGISDGYIYIKVLQLSGKRKNNIDEFLRGNNVTSCILLH